MTRCSGSEASQFGCSLAQSCCLYGLTLLCCYNNDDYMISTDVSLPSTVHAHRGRITVS